MQALTYVNWWQKSGIFLPISIVLRIRHLGEGTINDVMMMRWCHDNDVMIAATLHWLLLAMWHANHLINSHVIGKSENQYLPKKHETCFYEWTFGQIRVMSFRHPRWNPCTPSLHLMSPLRKYRLQLFTLSFMNSHDFNFLPELSKNVLSRRFQHVLSKGPFGYPESGIVLPTFCLRDLVANNIFAGCYFRGIF